MSNNFIKNNLSNLILNEKKENLKPTKTIIRKIPILLNNWELEEEEEEQEQEQEQEQEEKKIINNISLKEFENNLNNQKENLKPTTTIIKLSESPIEIIDLGFGNVAIIPKINNKNINLINNQEIENKEIIEYLIPEKGWKEMHGFLGNETWCPPRKISHNENEARPGYTSRLAHEYEDIPEVLIEKVKLLAKLIKKSSNCLIYTGAGISTSSGINDYASQRGSVALSNDERPRLRSPYEAKPTIAHHGVVSMYKSNLVHYWVQQNHDGLPQKAGLPQHAINEIHGAWYDPSNPVVAMNGQLRTDLFQDLLMWEEKTDLTISMGTTMCGMNSDRVFSTVASKALKEWNERNHKQKKEKKRSCNQENYNQLLDENEYVPNFIGGVIINLQQTQYDSISCLRIFCKLDKLMEMLINELGLPSLLSINEYKIYDLNDIVGNELENDDIFQIPYDSNGNLLNLSDIDPQNQNQDQNYEKEKSNESFFTKIKNKFRKSKRNKSLNERQENNSDESNSSDNKRRDSTEFKTILDLRVGSKIRIVSGPYTDSIGEVIGKNREGHYRIQLMLSLGKGKAMKPFERIMGSWWIESALKGTVPTIPLVNYHD